MSARRELLFSYGTLQLPEVQRANFGRELEGAPDVLIGFILEEIEITDPEVIAESGERFHLIAVHTGDGGDRVSGYVFDLTPDELAAADAYETDDYARVETTLATGRRAWVYARP